MSQSRNLDDLSFTLTVQLRGDGHLCNVLTHISRGDWRAVEAAIASILRPRARSSGLNALARNIVELACDGRGVTGPIMHDVFFGTLSRAAGPQSTEYLARKIARLRLGMRNEGRKAARAAATVTVERIEPRPPRARQAEPARKAA